MKIKTSFRIIILCSSLAIFMNIFSGCVKSNTPPANTYQNTITSILQSSNNVTLLNTALTRTGLDSLFNYYGPFTFFVTTDGAFVSVGITDTVFDNLPDSQLRKIVLYSALPVGLGSTQLPVGPNASTQTVLGDSVFITNNGSGIFVNGIQLVSTDVIASNGVIDAVAKPLLPPAGNFMQIAQADTSFSYFVAAVNRTTAGQINISALLSSGNIYTLFLPTNGAFQTIGYSSIDAINNADPDSLGTVLEYHLLSGRFFTSDFVSGQTHPTLLTNKSVTWGLLGGTAYGVKGSGNSSIIVISTPNIMARNGVIHVIGQLLSP
jgi:uncharacterized surface protein with fasciclin (FAS1) repeats